MLFERTACLSGQAIAESICAAPRVFGVASTSVKFDGLVSYHHEWWRQNVFSVCNVRRFNIFDNGGPQVEKINLKTDLKGQTKILEGFKSGF